VGATTTGESEVMSVEGKEGVGFFGACVRACVRARDKEEEREEFKKEFKKEKMKLFFFFAKQTERKTLSPVSFSLSPDFPLHFPFFSGNSVER
jgi:hypothetical protein